MRDVRRFVFLTGVALSVMATAASAAQTAGKCETPPFEAVKTGPTVVITVDWEKLKACADASTPGEGRVGVRVDEDTIVDVKAINFNFVAYTISYKVEETVVESYVALEKLWAQLLGLPMFGGTNLAGGPAAALVTECANFDACAGVWARVIALTNIKVDAARRQHSEFIVLNGVQRCEVERNRTDLANDKTVIENALKRVRDVHPPESVQQVTVFETVYNRHQALLDKLTAYESAAVRVRDGEIHHLGKKKAGRIVAVEMTPKDVSQAARMPVGDAEYFVHSRIPLVFHVGYAYAALKDVEFETVRSLSQADLFSVVKENTSTNTMLALLSLGRTISTDNFGVYASIGTDFAKPGERLYVGGSIQLFKRLFITVGKVSASREVGKNPVLERVGDALEARELFSAIETHRDWKTGFGAISFRAF
jgi:hypothetical protein